MDGPLGMDRLGWQLGGVMGRPLGTDGGSWDENI